MTVFELRTAQGSVWKRKFGDPETVPTAFHSLVESGVLASARDPFDPMEKSIP
jgi:hypothetical protein